MDAQVVTAQVKTTQHNEKAQRISTSKYSISADFKKNNK